MNDLTLGIVQIRPERGNADDATSKILSRLSTAKTQGADLVLFPECSLTGYRTEGAQSVALDYEDRRIKEIEDKAMDLGLGVCFGFIEKEGSSLFISQELFYEGKSIVYRKTHLGSKETGVFTEGSTFPMMEVRGVLTAMHLCWESHIPQISALYRKRGAQLLLFPYASGMSGEKCRENWSVHLPARASDNGCFAAASNLLMDTGGRAVGGGMCLWDAKGRAVREYYGDDENMIICTIGGELPREAFASGTGSMHNISYFDKARTELFETISAE